MVKSTPSIVGDRLFLGVVWTRDWDWGVEAWSGLGDFCGRKRLGLGGIGMKVGVRGGDFGGNGNIGGFCLGLVDLEFWRWGSGQRVGKGLGKWG